MQTADCVLGIKCRPKGFEKSTVRSSGTSRFILTCGPFNCIVSPFPLQRTKCQQANHTIILANLGNLLLKSWIIEFKQKKLPFNLVVFAECFRRQVQCYGLLVSFKYFCLQQEFFSPWHLTVFPCLNCLSLRSSI